MDNKDERRFPSADKVGFCSKLFFGWVSPVFRIVGKRPLEPEDIPHVPRNQASEEVTKRLLRQWKAEQSKSRPSLVRAVAKNFRRELLLLALLYFLETACLTYRPIVMRDLLRAFAHIKDPSQIMPACLLTAATLFLTLCAAILKNAYFWYGICSGIRLRLSMSGLIFDKMLTLNQKVMASASLGNVINLISMDVQKMEMAFSFLHATWLTPIQALVVLWLMYTDGGYASVFGIITLLIFIPIQTICGKSVAKIKEKVSRLTDERVRVFNELISGIHILKVFNWEDTFSKFVQVIRRRECNHILRARFVQAVQSAQMMFLTKLAMLVLLISLIFTHPDDPDLMAFLSTPLLEGETLPKVVDSAHPMICLNGVSSNWNQDTSKSLTLCSVSLAVEGPKLVAIVGPVGSGKSSLLQAILGELPLSSGSASRSQSIAYMPQAAWIFGGTVRENILCGQPFDPIRYQQVLRVSTLDADLRSFPEGDAVEVGEKGVALSGGQKSRIALARMAYTRANLVFLDDPLAAVDPRVAEDIFNNCIRGYMADRLRILVTNQHHLLPKMDLIVVMQEGRVTATGVYSDLVSQGVNFSEFTKRPDEVVDDEKTPQNAESQVEEGATSTGEAENAEKEADHADVTEVQTADEEAAGVEEAGAVLINADCDVRSEAVSSQDLARKRHARGLIGRDTLFNPGSADEPSSPNHNNNEHGRGNLFFANSSVKSAGKERSSNAATDSVAELNTGKAENETPALGEVTEVAFSGPKLGAEISKSGSIDLKDYVNYLKRGAGYFGLLASMLLYIITVALFTAYDFLLADWTNQANQIYLQSLDPLEWNNTNSSASVGILTDNQMYLMVLGIIELVIIAFSLFRTWTFYAVLTTSGRKIHNAVLRSLISAKMDFFQFHSAGQIINRLSKDVGQMDDMLPTAFQDFLQVLFNCVSALVVAMIASYWSGIPIILLLIGVVYYRNYYIRAARELKRIESVARSPIFAHLSVTARGLPCLRAARREKDHMIEYHRLVDQHTAAYYLGIGSNRWMSIRVDILCFLLLTVVSVMFLCLGIFSDMQSGTMAIVLIYLMLIIGVVQWALRQSAEVENQMVSIERLLEYIDLPPEEPPNATMNNTANLPLISVDPLWPQCGEVHFQNVWLKYPGKSNWALSNIDLHIRPSCKLGIIGRTGAGKSSLVSLLFRLVEVQRGQILIDQVNTAQVHLADLRRRISIIPQDPLLFVGTVRSNLDPEDCFEDEALWHALEAVQLKSVVEAMPGGLWSRVAEGGSNLSTGQRQLFSLARAILRGNKILLVDEATANVDPATDAIVQETIRTQFATNTILTIAHRLQTIIDSDEVIVMDAGRIVEQGSPYCLLDPAGAAELNRQLAGSADAVVIGLQQSDATASAARITSNGFFAGMVLKTGETSAAKLTAQARRAYLLKIAHRTLSSQ
ncbi:hypothetical protein AAHC03_010095 [Spirometra sp. Aus1]